MSGTQAHPLVQSLLAALQLVDGRVTAPAAALGVARDALAGLPPKEAETVALQLVAVALRFQQQAGESAQAATAALIDLAAGALPQDALAALLDGMDASVPRSGVARVVGVDAPSLTPVGAGGRAGQSPLGVRFPGLGRKEK